MRQSNLIGIIVGSLLILGGISAAIWWFSGPGGWDYYTAYGSLGTVEDYPTGIEHPNVYVNFEGTTSSLDIISDTMSNDWIVEVENIVKGPEEYAEDYPSEANYWNISDDGEGNYTLDYIVVNPEEAYHFVHEITIIVDYRANLLLDLASSTGSIYVETQQPDTLINITKLSVTTGSIDVNLEDDTVLVGNLNIESSTGSVELDFNTGTTLDLTSFSIATTTGSINLAFVDLTILSNFDFDLSVVTGGLNLDWQQYDSLITNHTFTFVGSTGSVSISLDFEPNIGTNFIASATTGSVSTPPNTASQGVWGQFIFDVTVTTGSIDINRN